MKKVKRYTIKGIVQGVGFRYYTQIQADRIGVSGFVRNLSDGCVEVYAKGSAEQLSILKEKLSAGPSYSRVEEIIEEDVQVEINFNFFVIK